MLVTLVVLAGLAGLLVLMGWLGAESRPAFIDPNRKQRPFVTPIRHDADSSLGSRR